MKTLSLMTVGWMIFAANGFAAPGGGSAVGTAATTGGGHAASAAPAGHVSSASAGVSHAGLGGGFRSSGVATGGARSSFGGVGISRSPGIATTQAGTVRALPPMPTVHNAWSDPVNPRVAGTSAAYSQGVQTNRLRTGQNLYPGADGYVPSRPASGRFQHGQGGDGARGSRRSYYNNFPYPVYYPFLYGSYGYGGIGDYGAVGDYAGLASDNNDADLGAPDFSTTPNNYYGYVAPTQDATGTERPTAPPQALPDAPAVGPQSPSTAAKSADDSQGPDSLVEAVQDELIKRGYFGGKADSMYSTATREAIRRFQTDQGLPATGRINEATLRALHLD